jgi:hypothetical protein
MRPHIDPACMMPDERLREVAAILAAGLQRRRDRAALASAPAPRHPLSTGEGQGEGLPHGEGASTGLDKPSQSMQQPR